MNPSPLFKCLFQRIIQSLRTLFFIIAVLQPTTKGPSSYFVLASIYYDPSISSGGGIVDDNDNDSTSAGSSVIKKWDDGVLPSSLPIDDITAFDDNRYKHPLSSTTTSISSTSVSSYNSIERGGSSIATRSTPKMSSMLKSPNNTQKRKHGSMDYESIALALRLTCEVNRRLYCGSMKSAPWGLPPHDHVSLTSATNQNNRIYNHNPTSMGNTHNTEWSQANYSHVSSSRSSIVNVHPSQYWERPIPSSPSSSLSSSSLSQPKTIFHTPSNMRPSSSTNLASYIQLLSKILSFDETPIIPALAMIYLDQACSAQTDRSGYDNPIYCPYISHQTVHKLYLTAIILACRVVRNQFFHHDTTTMHYNHENNADESMIIHYYCNLLKEGGILINEEELSLMMRWMIDSLGVQGLMVDSTKVNRYLNSWKHIFTWEEEESTGASYYDRDLSSFTKEDNF